MSSERDYPRSGYGRPWNRHKYFGHHIGTWSEVHPKKVSGDGCGFAGIPQDFSKTWHQWRKNYHLVYSAGGPHSVLGDTKIRPPPPLPGQRASGAEFQLKEPFAGGVQFHPRGKRCSSGFLVPPRVGEEDLLPGSLGREPQAAAVLGSGTPPTPASDMAATVAPASRYHPGALKPITSRSHQSLWYDGGCLDREFTGYTRGRMPGLTSSSFRREQHTNTQSPMIQF